MKLVLQILLLAISILAANGSVSAESCLKFGVQNRQELVAVGARVIQHLQSVGICSQLIVTPQARLPASLSSGEIDGEVLRDIAYAATVGEFAEKIEEPVARAQAIIVTRDSNINRIDDLSGRVVAVVRGTSWTNIYSQKFESLVEVDSSDQLLKMLGLRRIDAILTNSYTWAKIGGETRDLKVIPFRDLSVYIWLAKRNSGWSGRIDRALKDYKSNGGSFLAE